MHFIHNIKHNFQNYVNIYIHIYIYYITLKLINNTSRSIEII